MKPDDAHALLLTVRYSDRAPGKKLPSEKFVVLYLAVVGILVVPANVTAMPNITDIGEGRSLIERPATPYDASSTGDHYRQTVDNFDDLGTPLRPVSGCTIDSPEGRTSWDLIRAPEDFIPALLESVEFLE